MGPLASKYPPAGPSGPAWAIRTIRAQQESGAITSDAPPSLILMAVMALATAWSPVFPFGATANPDSHLPPDTIRDAIAGMIARIVGQK